MHIRAIRLTSPPRSPWPRVACAPAARAAMYEGRKIDGRWYEGRAVSTTYGSYRCQIKFNGDRAFFARRLESRSSGIPDEEVITDLHRHPRARSQAEGELDARSGEPAALMERTRPGRARRRSCCSSARRARPSRTRSPHAATRSPSRRPSCSGRGSHAGPALRRSRARGRRLARRDRGAHRQRRRARHAMRRQPLRIGAGRGRERAAHRAAARREGDAVGRAGRPPHTPGRARARARRARRCQVDFDAPRWRAPFYRGLLARMRSELPGTSLLMMTALSPRGRWATRGSKVCPWTPPCRWRSAWAPDAGRIRAALAAGAISRRRSRV